MNFAGSSSTWTSSHSPTTGCFRELYNWRMQSSCFQSSYFFGSHWVCCLTLIGDLGCNCFQALNGYARSLFLWLYIRLSMMSFYSTLLCLSVCLSVCLYQRLNCLVSDRDQPSWAPQISNSTGSVGQIWKANASKASEWLPFAFHLDTWLPIIVHFVYWWRRKFPEPNWIANLAWVPSIYVCLYE